MIDQLYDLILEYFNTQASSIGFPELALPTVIQVRRPFTLQCVFFFVFFLRPRKLNLSQIRLFEFSIINELCSQFVT